MISIRNLRPAPVIVLADLERSRLGKIIHLLPGDGDEPRILRLPRRRPARRRTPEGGPAIA